MQSFASSVDHGLERNVVARIDTRTCDDGFQFGVGEFMNASTTAPAMPLKSYQA
jgi:hypothetical protein